MSLKNFLIKTTLQCLPFPKNVTEKPERILVISTTALGDTLWATPSLESLRASFPHAHITVMTSPIGMEILKHNPWSNQLLLFQNPILMCPSLRKEKFDTALILHTSQRLPLPLAVAAGASRIVGTVGLNKKLDSLLTHPLPSIPQHEIERRLKMVEAIGGKITSETLSFFLQEEEQEKWPGRWIAIHPGSKDRFKRWPPSHFIEVGRSLQKKTGYQILITGTPDELDLMKFIHNEIPGSQLIPSGLSLRRFAALLAAMELLISNDTGPVHLALALKRPVVAIYSSTNPKYCGPHRAKEGVALARPPTCHPCLKRKCRGPFCFWQIDPREVIDAGLKLLK